MTQERNLKDKNKALLDALHEAARAGNITEVKRLTATDILPPERTILHFAALHGYAELIKALAGPDNINLPTETGCTALYCAAQQGYVEALKALIEANADLNIQDDDGSTALHIAAQQGHVKVVQILISNPALIINLPKKGGYTALYQAAMEGHTDVVQALIEAGADINFQKADNGYTALHIAALNGHIKVVKAFIEAKANLNVQATNGFAALHFAAIGAYDGCLEVVKRLLKANADIEKYSVNDNGALHVAIWNGQKETAVELVKAGAKMDVHNVDAQTPVSLLYSKAWGAEVILLGIINGNDVRKLAPAFVAAHPELQLLWIKALKEKFENLINEYKAQVSLPHTAYSMFIEQKIQKDALPCAVPTLQEICMQKLLQNPEQVLKKYTMNRDFGLGEEQTLYIQNEEIPLVGEE